MIRLQPFNFSEEKIGMIYIAAPEIPTRLLHRGGQEYEGEEKKKDS